MHTIYVEQRKFDPTVFYLERNIARRIVLMQYPRLMQVARICGKSPQYHFPFIGQGFIGMKPAHHFGEILIQRYQITVGQQSATTFLYIGNRLRGTETFLVQYAGVLERPTSFRLTETAVNKTIEKNGYLILLHHNNRTVPTKTPQDITRRVHQLSCIKCYRKLLDIRFQRTIFPIDNNFHSGHDSPANITDLYERFLFYFFSRRRISSTRFQILSTESSCIQA